jgi:predicted nucleic acid-binding protein
VQRVLVDADVLFAAAASPSQHGASLLILRLAELTLIQAVAPTQVVVESQRNMQEKLPHSVGLLQALINRALIVVPDPSASSMEPYAGTAHPKDLSILVAAATNQCPWLVSFNIKDYQPGLPSVRVLRPGDFLLFIRQQLTRLGG